MLFAVYLPLYLLPFRFLPFSLFSGFVRMQCGGGRTETIRLRFESDTTFRQRKGVVLVL